MPKRKTKDTEGVVLCLAHKDGRVACAKTGKLLNGGETQGYRRVNIGGKGGDYYEFRDLSVPDDIKDFVEVRVLPALLEREVPPAVKNAYLGRTFVDTDTNEHFTVCDVWNNYHSPELKNVDHSLRLCLWFHDAKYKKLPAKKHRMWCQVATMAEDGYKFVDDGVSARADVSKKRKTGAKK